MLSFALQLKNESESSSSECGSPLCAEPNDRNVDEPPPQKHFKHLTKVLERKMKEGVAEKSKPPQWKAELEHYFLSGVTLPENEDPLNYWVTHESTYPLLSNVAVDLLCIPASSAPIERTFSTAGESTSGRRNRLADKNLERETLLRKNRHYL